MKPDDADDFDFASIVQLVLHYKVLVATLMLLLGGLAGWLAFTTKPTYRAEVAVTEVREHGSGSLGALASQLGGLASIAGVNIGGGAGGGSTPSQEAAAVLESHRVAEEFIRRNDLVRVVLKNNTPDRQTMWLAIKEFTSNVLTIRKDQRKGVTTVSMLWTDPAVAAKWANGYVALTNELIRARALDESNRNITYLNAQLAKTDSVDLRKVMYSLIENETKTLMVANGRTEYAYEIVDPATTPEVKVGPHRLLNTLVGLLLGFLFGTALAFALNRYPRFRERVRNVNAPG